MTIIAPSIADEARAYMAAEIALHAGAIECAFVCAFDEATRQITSARLMTRGTAHQVPVVQTDLRAGDVVLHNHPITYGTLGLSDLDLAMLSQLAPQGIGFGVIDNAANVLLLAREPRLPWQWLEPSRPSRTKTWALWRCFLSYTAGGAVSFHYQPPLKKSHLPPIGQAL